MQAAWESTVAPRLQEALLIDAIPEMAASRLLCTSAGLAQFAVAAARALPDAQVTCSYFDLYRANLASNHWSQLPPNLAIDCAADLPEAEADVVAIPISASGEAELVRDVIQSGHERLGIGGKFYAATDNANDTWLGQQLQKAFGKVECRRQAGGTLYVGVKTATLKKRKNFTCEFIFRDLGRLIRVLSRPGVFSHRRIDPGARHLINEMQIGAGMRVLDIGCGAGVVALAAACRASNVHVHAVDSHCRAIECTWRGAELNGLTNVSTELNASGGYAGAGTYDLALANPPYYADFRIARHFLTAGRAALREGGTILVVTKQPQWYDHHMAEWYADVVASERKGYYVLRGVRSIGI
jgi:16S rRNA (guanine1207-N2)-methyltransferase